MAKRYQILPSWRPCCLPSAQVRVWMCDHGLSQLSAEKPFPLARIVLIKSLAFWSFTVGAKSVSSFVKLSFLVTLFMTKVTCYFCCFTQGLPSHFFTMADFSNALALKKNFFHILFPWAHFIYLFIAFLRATHAAPGSSQAGGQIWAAATSLATATQSQILSCTCNLYCNLRQNQILNPLEALEMAGVALEMAKGL